METNLNIDKSLHDECGQLLLDFIRGKMKGEKVDAMKVKAAMSGYNGSTRAMSTLRAADAMQYTIIRDLTDDKRELKKYVMSTMPDYLPKTLLE